MNEACSHLHLPFSERSEVTVGYISVIPQLVAFQIETVKMLEFKEL